MYRVRTNFTGVPGAPYLSTMYFAESGGTAQQAATAAGAFWTALIPNLTNSMNFATEADVALVNAATGVVTGAVATTPVLGTGGRADAQLPRATQGLVRWLTGIYVAGRQVRGRTFIPGLTEDANITDGLVTPAVAAAINNAAATLIASPNADLEIWSRTLGQSNVATVGSTWTEFAILRSRRD
jgi:hypothetical protein